MSNNLPVALMKKLWKDTFHDALTYVNRIFGCWVDPEFSLYRKNGEGKLLSMLCAHDFTFTGGFKGLYLHGFATLPEARGNGLMTSLLKETVINGRNKGFDFLFLIPASDGLRSWYEALGFINTAPRYYTYTSEAINEFQVKASVEDTVEIIHRLEERQPYGSLIHSLTDTIAVAEEWSEAGNDVLVAQEDRFLFKTPDCISAIDSITLERHLSGEKGIKTYLYPDQLNEVGESLTFFEEPYAMIYPLIPKLHQRLFVNFLMD